MKNPNGPYPGRQLFVGMTENNTPALAYLVTGRSPASRERMAITKGDNTIIGPIGNTAYDPLRHYTGIMVDNLSGVAAVSNGIQTNALYETYRLLYNVDTIPTVDYAEKIMDGAKHEPDSLNTPRIGAVITKSGDAPVFIVAIKRNDMSAKSFTINPTPGALKGISTYVGDMAEPVGYNVASGLAEMSTKANTPAELAQYLYDISEANNNGDDIRVCAVGGMLINGKWEISIVNRF